MRFYAFLLRFCTKKTSIQLRGWGIKDTQKAVTRLIGLQKKQPIFDKIAQKLHFFSKKFGHVKKKQYLCTRF